MAEQDFSILTPYAAAIVWNYADRFGTLNLNKDKNTEVDQVVLSTLSLKSIQTTKSKGGPAGNFELRLAPTKNWVTVLSPGSWMCLLMSRTPITKDDLENKADAKKVKWFGRIESVRVTVTVNQKTGAKQTEYIVQGTDWGSIFNTTLYIDPSLGGSTKDASSIGHAAQLIYAHQIKLLKGRLPSTTENIGVLMKLWGNPGPTAAEQVKKESGYIAKPIVNFTIPLKVAKYFGFTSNNSVSLIDIVKPITGKLRPRFVADTESEDRYTEIREALGVVLPSDVLGNHNFWSVMIGQSNQVLNEMMTDLRWDNGKVELGLYKRIRPFITDMDSLTKDKQKVGDDKKADYRSIADTASEFKHLRRIRIPIHEVISFNAGTNWRDKFNLVEIQLDRGLNKEDFNPVIKIQSQFYDEEAFGREGLKPMLARTRQFPSDKNGNIDARGLKVLTSWKYLLKEWYFNVHRMLNGSITFFGQDDYIQVGDNIIVDSKVMGLSYNTNEATIKNRDKSFLLAHVESVQQDFTVGPNGERQWVTSVQFVRGIITDTNGETFKDSDGMVEQDTTIVQVSQELNNANVISTSTEQDPD